MRHYEVRREIAAPAARIWTLLTDAERLVAADLGITRLEGRVALGEKLTIWSSASPGRGFPTRVVELDPPHRMVWAGGLPLGLFRGVRRFTLTEHAAGTTFAMREEFTGPLLPLIWRSMPDLQPSFDAFAEGVARTVEKETP